MKLEWICHVAIGFEVLSSVNNAHASTTKLLENVVVRYGLAYHGMDLHAAVR
jgi:hypothetical protein